MQENASDADVRADMYAEDIGRSANEEMSRDAERDDDERARVESF